MSHAKFSPSAAERWLHCGYSIKMAPFFKSTDTPASINGTNHHTIAALHLDNGTETRIKGMNTYLKAVRDVAVDGELFVERRVVIVPDLCEGTLDAGVLGGDWLHVFDLKWGKTPVHATLNSQMMLYALGVVREFQLKKTVDATLTIVQPNSSSGFTIKNWDTTVEYLLKFYEKVQRAIEEGLKPEPKAVPGGWCYWCPAKMHCKAYLTKGGKK